MFQTKLKSYRNHEKSLQSEPFSSLHFISLKVQILINFTIR
jgi:hypothetical protein